MANKTPIHKRLKEIRKMQGISQKKLGIAAGIDEFVASARMNQYEVGKHVPDFAILEQIAKVLKIPTAYFYATDDLLAELVQIYGSLTMANKRELLKVAKKISK